jgi:hypothetical protein
MHLVLGAPLALELGLSHLKPKLHPKARVSLLRATGAWPSLTSSGKFVHSEHRWTSEPPPSTVFPHSLL